MPRAFDLRTPTQDHSPLANLLDFSNIDATVELAGSLIKGYLDSLLDGVVDIIFEATGLDLQVLADLLQTIDISSPEAFVQSLINILINLPAVIVDLAAALIESGAGFLGADSPLNALNLFNLIPTDLMAHIPASNIGTAITNLIADANFLDPESFSGLDTWFHDALGGFGGTGAAKTFADGTTKELLGNLIPVSAGQVLPISGKAKWTGLFGTGNPVALAITGYTDTGASVQQTTIASHNTVPPTTDWIDLFGTYTVPDNVTALRTRLVVASTASAGTVHFSKMSATKIGPMLQRLIAGTDPGEFLPDDIANLFTGIVTNAMELVNKAGLTDFNDLVSTIGGDVGDDIAAAGERLNNFLDSLSPLNANNINAGNISDQFVAGITTINQNLFTRLLGAVKPSGVYTHTDAADALAQTSFAAVDTSARLAQLENTFTGGVSDGDDFERASSSSLGAGWLTYYTGGSGTWATPNGHDASFDTSGTQDREFFAIRNTGQIRSATDLQREVLIIGSTAARFWLPGVYNYAGHNDIWLRISDATTGWANITGIRIRFGGDGSASICRFVNGVNLDGSTAFAYLPTGTLSAPGPGSSIWAESGTPGVARYFRCGIGTATHLEVTEVGTASQVGPAFRRWGHGGRAEGHLLPLPGQERPASVHQETRKDQLT